MSEKQRQHQEILEKIARDKAERTGRPVSDFLEKKNVDPIKEEFSSIYNKIYTIYGVNEKGKARVNKCIATIGIYLGKKIFLRFLTF